MLKSLSANLRELQKLSTDLNERALQRLLDINKDLLTFVIAVLEPFDSGSISSTIKYI